MSGQMALGCWRPVRLTHSVFTVALVLLVGGCGGGGGGSYIAGDISKALGLRHEGSILLYALPSGKDCIVVRVLTSADQVKAAQNGTRAPRSAIATNSRGDIGVEFGGGYSGFSPSECTGPASRSLNALAGGG